MPDPAGVSAILSAFADDPTTGVVVDGAWWFIANSHIAGFDRREDPEAMGALAPTVVRRVRLQ